MKTLNINFSDIDEDPDPGVVCLPIILTYSSFFFLGGSDEPPERPKEFNGIPNNGLKCVVVKLASFSD